MGATRVKARWVAVVSVSLAVGCGAGCSRRDTHLAREAGLYEPSGSISTPLVAPSSTAVAADGSPSENEDNDPPLDHSPAGIAKALAGIAEFQRLVQQRLAIGREPNAVCLSKVDARSDRFGAIEKRMGGRRWLEGRRTRYACCAPYLDQTIDFSVSACLILCTDDDTPRNGSDDDDWGGPGGLRVDCQQSVTALADWAADLRAGRF